MAALPLPRDTHVDPSATVHPEAELAAGVQVGAHAIVHADTRLGEGCRIEAFAVVGPHTRLGRNNQVHHHAVVGAESQDGKFRGERSFLIAGDDNIFREFCTVNRATGEDCATRIGSGNRLLAYSHVAHNCVLGDDIVLANAAQAGGEVLIEDHAIIGGLVGIHQFCHIGAYAIVGSNSKVNQDILPFTLADGHPARPRGLNLVGLRRHGFSPERIRNIRRAYRTLFQENRPLRDALAELRVEPDDDITRLLDFSENSSRGLARPRAV